VSHLVAGWIPWLLLLQWIRAVALGGPERLTAGLLLL